MFNVVQKEIKIGDKIITIETGRIARQASSVFVTCGETQVLVAVTAKPEASPNQAFFPLAVDYTEKLYSAGRIPGGYIKRESRPTEKEVLVCRLIDRGIRPLFPETYLVETQVVATVVSNDASVPPAMLAILGASAALHISDIPFAGPLAAARVGYKDGKFLINPTEDQIDDCELDLVVSGTKNAIMMVEAGANFVSEELVLKGIEVAHEQIKIQCAAQEDFRKKAGVEKRQYPATIKNDAISKGLEKKFGKAIKEAYKIAKKSERRVKLDEIRKKAQEALVAEGDAVAAKEFSYLFEMICYKTLRTAIIGENRRVDGRKTTDIRDINCQVHVLKRPHGSALFTRGETQSLGVVTLGTSDDAQRSESLLSPLEEKHFMLHYNMPGYAVGEPKRMGAPARREVGHGNLAERALRASIPPRLRFPYSIRVVSEVTESNGSSSMASVCSATLAMLDAGVPLVEPIAGIAMGLVVEGEEFAVLSDILGDEDNLGDMDFKVAGGKSGITAMQMDIKLTEGLSMEVLEKALAQAHAGRMHILSKMNTVQSTANDISDTAPRIEQIKVKPEKIKDVIGPGGKNIKRIVAESGCKIDIDDSGIVSVASMNGEQAAIAKRLIQELTSEPEIGGIVLGIVKKVTDFGAFVEIKPGVEGLVHISQLAAERVNRVEDVVKEGDEVMVKIIEIDRMGKIKLSRKDALTKVEPFQDKH